LSCTHVIAGVNDQGLCQRTVKYLLAILDGKWIVSVDCTTRVYSLIFYS
jgi:BRCA1-associated RING domain protein 1